MHKLYLVLVLALIVQLPSHRRIVKAGPVSVTEAPEIFHSDSDTDTISIDTTLPSAISSLISEDGSNDNQSGYVGSLYVRMTKVWAQMAAAESSNHTPFPPRQTPEEGESSTLPAPAVFPPFKIERSSMKDPEVDGLPLSAEQIADIEEVAIPEADGTIAPAPALKSNSDIIDSASTTTENYNDEVVTMTVGPAEPLEETSSASSSLLEVPSLAAKALASEVEEVAGDEDAEEYSGENDEENNGGSEAPESGSVFTEHPHRLVHDTYCKYHHQQTIFLPTRQNNAANWMRPIEH
ncbi:hypothetical protein TYRP_006439 [Tyrophagus putrescentiae]|nr:hypothetical protein TYRP_006439 [Tyrophagus putrescentiae]